MLSRLTGDLSERELPPGTSYKTHHPILPRDSHPRQARPTRPTYKDNRPESVDMPGEQLSDRQHIQVDQTCLIRFTRPASNSATDTAFRQITPLRFPGVPPQSPRTTLLFN